MFVLWNCLRGHLASSALASCRPVSLCQSPVDVAIFQPGWLASPGNTGDVRRSVAFPFVREGAKEATARDSASFFKSEIVVPLTSPCALDRNDSTPPFPHNTRNLPRLRSKHSPSTESGERGGSNLRQRRRSVVSVPLSLSLSYTFPGQSGDFAIHGAMRLTG